MKRSLFAATVFVCSMAFAQSTAPLAFEVASIRPHQGPLHVMMGFTAAGTHLNLEGYDRKALVLEAFGLKDYQLVWGPAAGAKDDVFYDVVAKAEGDAAPSKEDLRRMLQTLLVQRLNLKFHYETKEIRVYALTVGKNGPKLKESAPDASASGLFGVHGRNQTIEIPRESADSLATHIASAFMLDRPVVDRTGLAGSYDVRLEATPQFRIENNPQPDDLSIFTAVQEQLGLKLEPTKAPVQVLVVDHIEKPSEN